MDSLAKAATTSRLSPNPRRCSCSGPAWRGLVHCGGATATVSPLAELFLGRRGDPRRPWCLDSLKPWCGTSYPSLWCRNTSRPAADRFLEVGPSRRKHMAPGHTTGALRVQQQGRDSRNDGQLHTSRWPALESRRGHHRRSTAPNHPTQETSERGLSRVLVVSLRPLGAWREGDASHEELP